MRAVNKISTPVQSDAELFIAYRQSGNLEILAALFQRYMDLIYGVCLKYLKDPDNAQDHTMSIFEELMVKLKKHEVDNFKSWLHVVVKNHCLMHLRAQKKHSIQPLEEDFMQYELIEHLDGETAEETFQKLDYCLKQLAVEQKHIIELFYMDGKCYNEIALITGMEWNKIRSYIQNGRRNLKICIEKQREKTVI